MGFCECDIEHSGSGGEYHDHLSNYHLFKIDPLLWSSLVSSCASLHVVGKVMKTSDVCRNICMSILWFDGQVDFVGLLGGC